MTQYEKILTLMVSDSTKVWWYPPDFMQPGLGELFVGYEASARLSEMAKQWPTMFESRKRERYLERRIRFEDITDWWVVIPPAYQQIIRDNWETAQSRGAAFTKA